MSALEATDSEKTVLGGVLVHQSKFVDMAAACSPEDFGSPAHRAIATAMRELDEKGNPIDCASVLERMQAADCLGLLSPFGGGKYLSRLMGEVVTVENLGYHAQVVRRKAERRRTADACDLIAAKMRAGGDDEQALEDAHRELAALIQGRQGVRAPEHVKAALRELRDALEQRHEAKAPGGITGTATGFHLLDGMTSGLHRKKLYVIAGRPSMGKSTLALNMMAHGAAHGVPQCLFSLEMGKEEIGEKLSSADGRIHGGALRSGTLKTPEWVRVSGAFARIAEWPFYIDDDGGITMSELRARARRWRAKHAANGPAVVYLDYLQLLRGEQRGREQNREREVAEQSRALKQLSKELDCAVVALSQLNRSLESRVDKRPMLSDLRESGAIEQDADFVAFIYRDEVYTKAESKFPGLGQVIIGKQRGGAIGAFYLGFEGEYSRFFNLEQQPSEEGSA